MSKRWTQASVAPFQSQEAVTERVATTVKLDRARHRRLKLAGIDDSKSCQAILVDALDAYLAARQDARAPT